MAKLALHTLSPESTVSTEAIESSERGDSLARKRFQRGHVFLIGGTWFCKYREDVIESEGNTRRKQVTVTLGSKKDIPTKPLRNGAWNLFWPGSTLPTIGQAGLPRWTSSQQSGRSTSLWGLSLPRSDRRSPT